MDDLVKWLRAQLDEDERIAQAAGSLSGVALPAGARWRVSGSHADDGGTYWSVTTASPDLDRVPVVEMVGSGMSGGGAHTEEVAVHIAEWNPARVLREIDAKRQILAQCAYWNERAAREAVDPPKHPQPGLDLGLLLDAMNPVLRLLALPYADRAGYREDWRP